MERDSLDALDKNLQHLVSKLRFKHLQLLVVLSKRGSLRACAEELALTQPALSKSLKEIETAFGATLFERGARGLMPTERGHIVVRGATLLLEELSHLGKEALGDQVATVLRVGAPPFVAQEHLPAVFARLLASGEKIRLRLHETRVPTLIQLLLAGELDAVVTSMIADLDDEQRQKLRYEPLFEASYVVIGSKSNALVRSSKIDWTKLATQPWVMPARNSMVRYLIEDVFRRQGLLTPTPVVESTDPVTNLRFVAEGLGFSVVPEATLRSSGFSKAVRALKISPGIMPSPVALLSRHGPDNPRIYLLRDALGLRRA